MSLKSKRSRTRLPSNRANTLPAFVPGSFSSATDIPPSIEDSLQQWLSQSTSDPVNSPTAWVSDSTCRCCGQPGCEQFETLANTIKKLEGDTRLAAEIGQSLLQKHESFVAESKEIKAALMQELEEARDKNRQLEQLLEEAEAARQELTEQKDKATWEWQKTQKTLQETVADLEAANARCVQLSNDLKSETLKVDKLRVFKFMARQADIREENLRAKLEDTKQELAVTRKSELMLESKHKKLRAKYESLSSAYERLKLDQQELGITDDKQINLAWLRESNEKLRSDMLKLSSTMAPGAPLEQQQQQQQQGSQQLVTLIKELAAANSKLKNELLDCRELLSETRSEAIALNCRLEELERREYFDDHDPFFAGINKPAKARRASTSARERPLRPKANIPSSTSSASMPTRASVVHHHYHYHLRPQEEQANSRNEDQHHPTDENLTESLPAMKTSLSTSTTSSEVVLEEDTENPYHVLQTNAAQTLERLRATDIRALNRRLRKAFDIFELGTMSNSIIENVLTEVEALRSRFMWMEDEGCNAESWKQDVTLNDFFALVGVIQDMLTEIGQLRMTMNDLQSEYVKKVEENDARVEEEILRSREQKRASRSNSNTTFSAFAWFINVFAKAPPPSPPATSPKKLKRITSNESVSSTTKQNRRIASIVETEKSKPIILRHKRSDIDRHGPPSSFPRSSEKYRQHRMASYGGSSSSTSQAKPIPYPTLQISRSGGSSVQRSKSMQAPALEYAAARPASFSFNNGYYTGSTVDFCTE